MERADHVGVIHRNTVASVQKKFRRRKFPAPEIIVYPFLIQ